MTTPVLPVGFVYITVVNENPAKTFGGVWQRFANGRCLFGVSENDDAFVQPKKTGGEKTHKLSVEEMPKHSHVLKTGRDEWDDGGEYGPGIRGEKGGDKRTTMSVGGDKAHNNLPPYITVYMFVRVS
jgi:hypothetical protein